MGWNDFWLDLLNHAQENSPDYFPPARPAGIVTAQDQAPVPGKAPTELLPPAPAPMLHSLTLSAS